MLSESKVNEVKSEVKHQPVKTEEAKLDAVKPEVMERGYVKRTKTTVSICKGCIGCWRFCLNSCKVAMDCNIRDPLKVGKP